MNSPDVSNLRKIWLEFLNTTKTDAGETWLDAFLVKYLSLLCDQSVHAGDTFSFQWKSSGNILAHQLLSDMYQICESLKTNSFWGNDNANASEPFKKYLLEGRGWKILWTLENIGIQNLLCLKDLTKLLILHIPVLMSLPVCASTLPVPLQRKPKLFPISDCFASSKRSMISSGNLKWPENCIPKKKRNHLAKKRVRRKRLRIAEKDSSSSSGEDPVLFEPCAIPASQLKALQKVNRISATPVSKSLSEVGESDPDVVSADFMVPPQEMADFGCYSISVIDYMHFILNLFQESARLDQRDSEYPSCSASLILEFSLNALKDIHNGRYAFVGWPKEEVANVQDQLLKLVFLSATITYSSLSYTGAPNENEVISILLVICDEMLTFQNQNTCVSFICNVIKGCSMLINTTIETYSQDFAKVICIVRTFYENGANLLYNIISILDKESTDSVNNDIDVVISLIKSSVMLLKSEKASLISYQTSSASSLIKDFIHHHDNALGSFADVIDNSKEPVCCVATMSGLLLKICSLPVSRHVMFNIIKQLKVCGICCCLNPGFVLKSLLCRFESYDFEVQRLALVLIEKYLFPQMGLTINTKFQCLHCSPRLNENDIATWPVLDNSGFHLCPKSDFLNHNLNITTTFWNSFSIYGDLLNGSCSETVENVVKHLIQIFTDGAKELKNQIFIRVILPQFLMVSSSDGPLSLTQKIKCKCFLAVFQLVFYDSTLSAIFINFGGMPTLYPFLLYSEFRKLSLNALKILIFHENEVNTDFHVGNSYSAMMCLPTSTTFCKFLLEHTRTFSENLCALLTKIKSNKGSEIEDCYSVSKEKVNFICDVWVCYKDVISNLKNEYIYKIAENAFDQGYNLFILLLENLSLILESLQKFDVVKDFLLLIQSLLTVCIKTQKEISIKLAILETVKCNFIAHPLKSEEQTLLFDFILKCCFSSNFFMSPIRHLYKDNFSKNVLDDATSSDKEGTDIGSYGESYAGDTEGSSNSCLFQNSSKYEIVHQSFIEHGEVVKMLFELLMQFQKRSLCNWVPSALFIIQNLVKLCQECEMNKVTLCEQEIPTMLLECIECSLNSPEESLYDFQNSALELFVILSQYSFQPANLQKIINFFKEKYSPVNLLLKCLNNLVDKIVDQPVRSVVFPCSQNPVRSTRLKKRLKTAYNIRNQYSMLSNVICAWTRHALCFPLTEDTGWNSLNKGFSFALWMKINTADHLYPFTLTGSNKNFIIYKRQESASSHKDLFGSEVHVLHLVSLGSDRFLLELWYDRSDKDLIVKILGHNNNEVLCLSKGVCKSVLQNNTWHHVSLNYTEESSKSIINSRVQIILDGTKENVFNLTYKRSSMNVLNNCHLFLGHSELVSRDTDNLLPSYSLGSFMFFKDVLSRDTVFYLSSLGPHVTNITVCALQKRSTFVPKPNMCQNVTSFISLDVFMGSTVPPLDALQNSLLCSYSAEKLTSYMSYPATSRGFFHLRYSFPMSGNTKLSTSQEVFNQKVPSELQALTSGELTSSETQDFQCALQRSGGITNFLFLFAFILESDKVEKHLPDALDIVLKLINKNTTFSEDFVRIKGYELLSQMICSKKCTVSNSLLKVLQENCLSNYIVNEELKANMHKFGKPAIILNASIFSLMLKSIAFAKSSSPEILSSLFSTLNCLLDPKIANVVMNVEQMNICETLTTLLWILKRNYIMSEDYFPTAVAKMIPLLMQKLLSYKFDGLLFKSICHFMLLLHKSSSTYVCHSRPSFFFFFIMDKLVENKKLSLKARSSSVWYAQEVDELMPKEQYGNSRLVLKRHSSFPGENAVARGSFSGLTKLASVDSLESTKSTLEKANIPSILTPETQSITFERSYLESNLSPIPENDATEICTGLLELIHSFILKENFTDMQSFLHLLQPEIFLVLAYTPEPEVRIAALKILYRYLNESSENVRSDFLSMSGFHLLSNQLQLFPFHEGVFDTCFSCLADTSLLSVEISHLYEFNDATEFQIMSWLPLLSILPKSKSNPLMCEKILLVLTKFLQVDPSVIVCLLQNGLCMSIIHLLIQMSLTFNISLNQINIFEFNQCFKAIKELLKVISTKLSISKKSKDFTALCDILHLFSAVEIKSAKEHGYDSPSVQILRDCQCVLYEIIIDLSKLYESLPVKRSNTLFNDDTVWELLNEFQETLGTFSTTSVPIDDIAVEPDALNLTLNELMKDVKNSLLEIPMGEIISRLETLLSEATHFIVFKDHRIKNSLIENKFIIAFFNFLIRGLSISMNKNVGINKTEYSTLMCSLKELLKKELGKILLCTLSPYNDPEVKEYFVDILATHPLNKKILHLVIYSISKIDIFLIFLHDLLINSPPHLKKNSFQLCSVVKTLLQGSSVLNVLKDSNNIDKLKRDWIYLRNEDQKKWIAEINRLNEKIFQKFEILSQEVSKEALKVTERVFEIQNNERKLFMEELKTKYSEETSERLTWFKLIEQMTHEKAPWYFPDKYANSWELDPTEGPLRTRKRLKRCFLNVDSRFLRSDITDGTEMQKNEDLPFINLLQHQGNFSDSAAVMHRLHSHEQIEYTSTCKIVTAFEEATVEILIGAYCIHLIGEETLSHMSKFPVSESLPFECIKEIVPRRYELQNNAFEIFLTNGLTYLIAFDSEREFQYIWRQLENHELPCQFNVDVSALTQLWRETAITNFEYLTQLNKLAGRSFNDLMQYPVFPYVLSEYSKSYLNLLDPSVYRDLEKPVAVQHKYREKFYKDTYSLLKEQSSGSQSDQKPPISEPYHYGSHYSNSGSVLHFLIRLLPYTYSFIKYQDNNFDIPDRAFHSIETSWQLVTKDSTSDVKELIPEFFFLSEFLCNKNGFDFGVRQSGIRVNDVLLPPWCMQNPRLFILINRQALESDAVTKNLHNWIDLVFGYKQTGEASVNAINVFHPATYFGFDIHQWDDPLTKQALKAMVKTLGQMPKQLFTHPHPMVSLSLSSLDLTDQNDGSMEVVDSVKGLRWGDFVGSPSTDSPSLVWCRKQSVTMGSLLPLLANYMFGLGENICLLLNHRKTAVSDISSATYIMSAALISWGHKDGVVRIKLCRDQPAVPLLVGNTVDPVCLCASVPDCKELFIAHTSGLIFVYSLYLGPAGQTVTQEQPPLQLNAHTDAVTSICICKAFSIFVSASKDCSVVVWDLNRLCYVRSLLGHNIAVEIVSVSDTLGDIASSSNDGDQSVLRVHTINGEVVGNIKVPDIITALCYSTAPEGVSVNLIATGLRSGSIRLFSSWDLKPIREISCDRFRACIKCIAFSSDNQHLFASNASGTVAVWEKPSKGLTSVPRLLVFT